MISIKVDCDGVEVREVSGSIMDLFTDSLAVLKVVYDVVKDQTNEGADAYKKAIKDNIELAFGEEPAWKTLSPGKGGE